MKRNQKRPSYYPVPMTAAMNNVFAWRLGKVAEEAGDPTRKDVGDYIDRGLILRRLLEEAGFYVMVTDSPKNIPHLSDLVQPLDSRGGRMIVKGDALMLDTFNAVDSEYTTAEHPRPTQDVREYYKTLQEALEASEQALLLFADPFGKVADFQRYPMQVTLEQMKAIGEALRAIEKTK